MTYLLSDVELKRILSQADKDLRSSEKIKFQRISKWRKESVPDFPGVYALYEKKGSHFSLMYVGETGNLQKRMSDVCRTINHTFRRQLGRKRFNASRTTKKFDAEIELLLDNFFDESLYVSLIKVNFGRTEIESYLVTKYQTILLNSETKRKLKLELDSLEDEQQ